MASRRLLQNKLEEILGTNNVYFQPPPSIHMCYPAIVYSLEGVNKTFANGLAYNISKSYTLIVIDTNPEGVIADKVNLLPFCKHIKRYPKDGLTHDVFRIYY